MIRYACMYSNRLQKRSVKWLLSVKVHSFATFSDDKVPESPAKATQYHGNTQHTPKTLCINEYYKNSRLFIFGFGIGPVFGLLSIERLSALLKLKRKVLAPLALFESLVCN